RAGERAGTPLELKVKSGSLLVQVERDGFTPYEQRVEAKAGEPVRLAAVLKKIDILPPPPSPHARYEKLLTWVFRNQGHVTANSGGGEQFHLTSLAQLPNQSLDILGINLDGTGVHDADLASLAVAVGLRNLSLADTPITDQGLE